MRLLALLLLCAAPAACAQLRLCYPADTLQGRVRRVVEYRYPSYYRIKGIYTYDSAQCREVAGFYDENDSLQAEWIVSYDGRGRISRKALAAGARPPCHLTSYQYDNQDRKIGERDSVASSCFGLFDWLKGGMSNWMAIDFSLNAYRHEYDTGDRLVRTTKRNLTVAQHDSSVETGTTDYQFDAASGKIAQVETRQFRFLGRATDTLFNAAYYQYDSLGNNTKEIRLEGTFGKPQVDTIVTTRSYNSQNREVESVAYFRIERRDPDAKLGTPLGAGSFYEYDSAGKAVSRRSFDLYREPDGSETKKITDTWTRNPEYEEVEERDTHGNVVRIRRGSTLILSREIEYE